VILPVAMAVMLCFFGGWEAADALWHLAHGDATWGRAIQLALGAAFIALAVWCFDQTQPR
jgi:hypothetical protein